MDSRNPMFSEKMMQSVVNINSEPMTIQGALNKTFILTLVLLVSAAAVWYEHSLGYIDKVNMLTIGGLIIGFILAMVIIFKKTLAPYLAPIYAFAEGAVLGGISAQIDSVYPGIAIQAVGATITVVLAMVILYKSKIITVTDKFRSVLLSAGFAILGIYLLTLVLGFFGKTIPYIYGSGPIGIGFSIIVCIVASFFLLIDFDFLEKSAQAMLPKYMEWYGAFGIMVTLVWLYIEILNLLAKLRNR